ncbi:CehA/McbA family metallohydrolase [Halorubellus salinus]|uniref:CehA/McbA family metallohydrolase n=1 Tax=Halorubellus salinus TaxID=755309 RepID=UPI001D0704D7|nr:PHP domain-containing protein [Halorubellus salinus]
MRTLAFDPHVHTEGSWDSNAAVEDVLAAAADAGLDGLAVTDHDAVDHSLYAVERAPEFGLFAIPGVEVSTLGGHLLALGVETTPPEGRSFAWTVDWVHDRGGVAVAPHPFRRSSHGVGREVLRDADALDAVETFNACTVLGYRNRQARTFASRHDRTRLGGSDAHRPARVGDGYTRVHVRPAADPVADYQPILDAIREGRTSAHGRTASVRSYVAKFAVNAKTRTTR